MVALALSSIEIEHLRIPGADPWHAAPGDPALTVMTDFRERASVTVSAAATIDAALDHMKHTGVRCAFVTDDERRLVIGIITAYDITGEKPMRHMQAAQVPRTEVLVRDIAQKIADWRIAEIRDVEHATVAAVSRLFEESLLTHIPVMETSAQGERRLRGLLSAAKVKRLISR